MHLHTECHKITYPYLCDVIYEGQRSLSLTSPLLFCLFSQLLTVLFFSNIVQKKKTLSMSIIYSLSKTNVIFAESIFLALQVFWVDVCLSVQANVQQKCSGVNFINCFAPYTYLLHPALNFNATKKLLKSWAMGTNGQTQGAKPIMKLTPVCLPVQANIQQSVQKESFLKRDSVSAFTCLQQRKTFNFLTMGRWFQVEKSDFQFQKQPPN